MHTVNCCLQHSSSDVTDAARRAYIIHYGRLERKGSAVSGEEKREHCMRVQQNAAGAWLALAVR